jgi:hypothetical protein
LYSCAMLSLAKKSTNPQTACTLTAFRGFVATYQDRSFGDRR